MCLGKQSPHFATLKEMLYGGVILLAPRLRKHGIEAKARAGLDLLNREIPPPRSCDSASDVKPLFVSMLTNVNSPAILV